MRSRESLEMGELEKWASEFDGGERALTNQMPARPGWQQRGGAAPVDTPSTVNSPGLNSTASHSGIANWAATPDVVTPEPAGGALKLSPSKKIGIPHEILSLEEQRAHSEMQRQEAQAERSERARAESELQVAAMRAERRARQEHRKAVQERKAKKVAEVQSSPELGSATWVTSDEDSDACLRKIRDDHLKWLSHSPFQSVSGPIDRTPSREHWRPRSPPTKGYNESSLEEVVYDEKGNAYYRPTERLPQLSPGHNAQQEQEAGGAYVQEGESVRGGAEAKGGKKRRERVGHVMIYTGGHELAPQPLSGAQSRARYGNKSTKKRQVKAFAMYTMPVY